MNDSTDEDKTLAKNEKTQRKRKKRKSKQKKIESSEYYSSNNENTNIKCNAEENSAFQTSKRRSLRDLFRKPTGRLELSEQNESSTEDTGFTHEKLCDHTPIPIYSKFDPKIQPRTRLGCMTLKDAMNEKHSIHEKSPIETNILNNDSSDISASLPDIHDQLIQDSSNNRKKKRRSKSAEVQKRPRSPRATVQSSETANCSLFSCPDQQLSSDTKQILNDYQGPDICDTDLNKEQTRKRSQSKEFVISENQRQSFSAFLHLSQSNPTYNSLNRKSGLSQKYTNSKETDDVNSKLVERNKTNVIHQTSTTNLKSPEQTNEQNPDLSKSVSLMDTAASFETTSTAENTLRRVREEKQLDRRSYKSPRRFSGRSVSRERRKSGKSSEKKDKSSETVSKAENSQCVNSTENGTLEENAFKKLDRNIMSRSIQTSIHLLDIETDQSKTNVANIVENNVQISTVPVIVEHTIPLDIENITNRHATPVTKGLDEKYVSSSSESEEFKTPTQSPLPERKLIDEIVSEKTENDSDDKEKKKTSETNKKSQKLSFLAVVALKGKLARHRKTKKRKSSMDEGNRSKKEIKLSKIDNSKVITPEVSDKLDPSDLENKKSLTTYYLENETNFNTGTLSYLPETDILDVDEIKELHHKQKKISFDILSEQSGKHISDSYIHGHHQISSRRQSELFRQKRAKAITYCKKFVAFLFSHIGLCSLMVAYAIAGGIIFREIEGPYEIQTKIKVVDAREKTRDQIIELATELLLTKRSRDNVSKEIESLLKKFQTEVYIATDIDGFNNEETKNPDGQQTAEQWSLASSLLFAITVMTTIGYGHVAPKTDTGRIVTILYAVLGIPLTLLCLTNIGDLMATGFRMLYAKVCCGVCCILFSPKRRRMPDPEKGSGISIEYQEGKSRDKSANGVVNVPTSVCILLMTSYIMLGTMLFSIWEGWDAITGTYFSFITLSTIGFGDVVPGTAMNQWENEEKLVLCAMYLIFGLSLIAMCFNLVQEDVKLKCRKLGAKLGIIDNAN